MQVSSKTNDHNYSNSSNNNNKNKKKKAIQQKHRKTRASSRRRQLLGSGHRCPYPSRCSQSKMLEGFLWAHNTKAQCGHVVLVIFPNFTSAAKGPGHCHNMIDKELNNMMVLHYEGYDALHLAQRWTSSNAILINVR